MAIEVRADYQERKRIIFTARGRSMVNVREARDDGPLGFSSIEMLLATLGNCVLGALLNHEALDGVDVVRAESFLEADMASNPRRVVRIRNRIELDVTDPAVLERRADLEAESCTCPICNTLSNVEISTSLALRIV